MINTATATINRGGRCEIDLKVLHAAGIEVVRSAYWHVGHVDIRITGGSRARATLEATNENDDLLDPRLMAAAAVRSLASFNSVVSTACYRRTAKAVIGFGREQDFNDFVDLSLDVRVGWCYTGCS